MNLSTTVKIIIFACAVVTYKVVSNLLKMFKCKSLKKRYVNWIKGTDNTFSQEKGNTIKLLKGAGVKNSLIPVTQPSGYGKLVSFNADVWENFLSMDDVVTISALYMFDEAIGTYRRRIFESINPLYWIDLIIFAPKHLLSYIGLNTEKIASKICNILLTFLWWLLGVGFTFFSEDIYQFISYLLGQPK